jgi:hypothetical protein
MRALLPLLLVLLLAAPPAPGDGTDEPGFGDTDESTPVYEKGLELLKKKKWRAAQVHFRKMIEDYPLSVHIGDAELRSDDNCYLGTTMIHEGGPPERRIDVAVMGDGFTIDARDQALEEKWAKLCVDVLFNERSYAEYRDYFNIYFVRLASLEEGVDPQLSEEQRAKIEERNRRRTRKRKTEYDTALDCKAAGPQGQVMADSGLVYQWLDVAESDHPGCGQDRLVIAFARFGVLGMGGGGIANVGRPDKSITVHEFGHAFVGLLDEYTGNPNPPTYGIFGINACTSDDPEEVPWKHFLERRVKGVGIYEGGATYNKGVWRPAKTCAMNAAGETQYCPVCREGNVLKIYAHVSPIDTAEPDPAKPIEVAAGADTEITVTPMAPQTHELEVGWYVKPLAPDEAVPVPEKATKQEEYVVPWGGRRGGELGVPSGDRAQRSRERYDEPPAGEPSRLGGRGKRCGGEKPHVFPVGELEPGRYAVTVKVRDTTPWVLLDPDHLLEERMTWIVTVSARK